jgi:MFS family permease
MGTPVPQRFFVLALVVLARSSMGIQFGAVAPVTQSLMAELGFSYTDVGLLIGSFLLPGAILALPSGMLASRYSDKQLVGWSLVLLLGGTLLFAACPWLPWPFAVALLARVIGGAGGVLLNIQTTKIVTDWFAGREISTAMGFLGVAWPLGIALPTGFGGVLGQRLSWQGAMLVGAAFTAVALLTFLLLYPRRDAAVEVGAPPGGRAEPRKKALPLTRTETLLIAVSGLLWPLLNGGYIVFTSFCPGFLRQRGLSIAEAGFTVSLASWALILSLPLGGFVSDKTRRRDLFIAGGTLLGAVCIGLVLGGAPAAVTVFLYGFFLGLSPGPVMALPGEILRAESRAAGIGLFFTIFYLGMALLPPLGGALRDRTGLLTAPLILAALCTALTPVVLVVFRALQRRLRRPDA